MTIDEAKKIVLEKYPNARTWKKLSRRPEYNVLSWNDRAHEWAVLAQYSRPTLKLAWLSAAENILRDNE